MLMKQIQILYLENMPKGAHYSFNQSVVKRIKNDSTLCGKPQLIPLIAKYEAAFLVEEEKFKISQKSEFTDSLNQLDDMRDSAYRGIKQIVGGYAKVPDADIQKAAKALDQLITDYRINVDVQRDQESGLLSNFIADLDGKCAAHVQTLGMGKAVQVLKEANNQYIEVREVRTEERMHKEKKALETACAATDTAYRALIAMVNALALVEGETDYADFESGTVTVTSYETATHYCVKVADDGVGFDQTCPLDERKHIGIRNVRERLQVMCGGSLTVESQKGIGTTALLQIPKEGMKL